MAKAKKWLGIIFLLIVSAYIGVMGIQQYREDMALVNDGSMSGNTENAADDNQ
jgi:hypothetical protein